MVQMTMCNMKGVARNDKPTENYHSLLHTPKLKKSVIVVVSLL